MPRSPSTRPSCAGCRRSDHVVIAPGPSSPLSALHSTGAAWCPGHRHGAFSGRRPGQVASLRARLGAPLVLFVGQLRATGARPPAARAGRSAELLAVAGTGSRRAGRRWRGAGPGHTRGLAGRRGRGDVPALPTAADLLPCRDQRSRPMAWCRWGDGGGAAVSTELARHDVRQPPRRTGSSCPAQPAAPGWGHNALLADPDRYRRMGARGATRAGRIRPGADEWRRWR